VSYADHDDVTNYYETFGSPSRPALLLVNGLGSQCINYRVEWCEKFVAAGFFVIRFDNRDVGLSTKFDGFDLAGREPPYLVADMAGDAVAVLDDVGVSRAHVMGLSMGGMIVQQMAIDHPDRLLSLTSVMSTTGDPDVGQSTPEALAVLTGAPALDRDGAIARQLAAHQIYGSPACYDERRLTAAAAGPFDRCFCPDGQARQLRALVSSPSRSEGLRTVDLPALVLHGDRDTLIDISGGRRTAEVIPGARFVTMEGMGHDYPPEYWDSFVDLVNGAAGLRR
jgi:pimeloyl-ACP methyl ester carboxylesterase